jgi:predicted phosphoribosyltransferase
MARSPMASEPELRGQIAEERRELTNAVADLRKEIDRTAERGKQVAVAVGVATGVTVAVRTALKIRRAFRD